MEGGDGIMAGALFNAMAAVEMLHVPYRGPVQAITDLLSGRVQVMLICCRHLSDRSKPESCGR